MSETTRQLFGMTIVSGAVLGKPRKTQYQTILEVLKKGEALQFDTAHKAESFYGSAVSNGYKVKRRKDTANDRYLVFFLGKAK